MPQHHHLGRLTRSAELATGTEKMERGMRRYTSSGSVVRGGCRVAGGGRTKKQSWSYLGSLVPVPLLDLRVFRVRATPTAVDGKFLVSTVGGAPSIHERLCST